MLAYPLVLEDDDGAVLATSPDFPELATFGADREEAIARATHALEEAIAARIHDRKDIPPPSRGEAHAVLPTLTAVKVRLYQAMRDQGVGKAELARRLGWHESHWVDLLAALSTCQRPGECSYPVSTI